MLPLLFSQFISDQGIDGDPTCFKTILIEPYKPDQFRLSNLKKKMSTRNVHYEHLIFSIFWMLVNILTSLAQINRDEKTQFLSILESHHINLESISFRFLRSYQFFVMKFGPFSVPLVLGSMEYQIYDINNPFDRSIFQPIEFLPPSDHWLFYPIIPTISL